MNNILGGYNISVDLAPTATLVTDIDESIANLKLAKDDVTTVSENFLNNTCKYMGDYFEMAIMTTIDLAKTNYRYVRKINRAIDAYKVDADDIDKTHALEK